MEDIMANIRPDDRTAIITLIEALYENIRKVKINNKLTDAFNKAEKR